MIPIVRSSAAGANSRARAPAENSPNTLSEKGAVLMRGDNQLLIPPSSMGTVQPVEIAPPRKGSAHVQYDFAVVNADHGLVANHLGVVNDNGIGEIVFDVRPSLSLNIASSTEDTLVESAHADTMAVIGIFPSGLLDTDGKPIPSEFELDKRISGPTRERIGKAIVKFKSGKQTTCPIRTQWVDSDDLDDTHSYLRLSSYVSFPPVDLSALDNTSVFATLHKLDEKEARVIHHRKVTINAPDKDAMKLVRQANSDSELYKDVPPQANDDDLLEWTTEKTRFEIIAAAERAIQQGILQGWELGVRQLLRNDELVNYVGAGETDPSQQVVSAIPTDGEPLGIGRGVMIPNGIVITRREFRRITHVYGNTGVDRPVQITFRFDKLPPGAKFSATSLPTAFLCIMRHVPGAVRAGAAASADEPPF